MTTIAIDVFCCKCWNGHLAHVDCAHLHDGANRIESTCPHCGEELLVAYELRPYVVNVKPVREEFPQAWRLRGGQA